MQTYQSRTCYPAIDSYRRQDAIGTYYCLTVDTESLTNQTVTLRQRDSREQGRIKIKDIKIILYERYQKELSQFLH